MGIGGGPPLNKLAGWSLTCHSCSLKLWESWGLSERTNRRIQAQASQHILGPSPLALAVCLLPDSLPAWSLFPYLFWQAPSRHSGNFSYFHRQKKSLFLMGTLRPWNISRNPASGPLCIVMECSRDHVPHQALRSRGQGPPHVLGTQAKIWHREVSCTSQLWFMGQNLGVLSKQPTSVGLA